MSVNPQVSEASVTSTVADIGDLVAELCKVGGVDPATVAEIVITPNEVEFIRRVPITTASCGKGGDDGEQ